MASVKFILRLILTALALPLFYSKDKSRFLGGLSRIINSFIPTKIASRYMKHSYSKERNKSYSWLIHQRIVLFGSE